MLNMSLINAAVKVVEDFFNAEGIYEDTETIKARAINWYNHTEIIEVEMLAAATISGEYQIGMTWDDVLKIKEFYFPSIPIELENYHIGEIEAAQHDCLWW